MFPKKKIKNKMRLKLEEYLLTIILNMIVNHFSFENIAQFGECFQMINVNYQRPQKVVQVTTETQQHFTESIAHN